MAVIDRGEYLEVTLTNLNPSENMVNTAGSIEVAGTFTGPATVTQNLTGGAVAVDTFTAAETVFTNASALTFAITGGNGPITVKWWKDRSRSSRY